jgi:hypothetical protein
MIRFIYEINLYKFFISDTYEDIDKLLLKTKKILSLIDAKSEIRFNRYFFYNLYYIYSFDEIANLEKFIKENTFYFNFEFNLNFYNNISNLFSYILNFIIFKDKKGFSIFKNNFVNTYKNDIIEDKTKLLNLTEEKFFNF